MTTTAAPRGSTTDRLAFIAVSLMLLTITWNGFRVPGGALGSLFFALAILAVAVHVVIDRRPIPLPPWLLLSFAGLVLIETLNVIIPPNQSLTDAARIDIVSRIQTYGNRGVIVPDRSDFFMLLKFTSALVVIPVMLGIVGRTRERCSRLIDAWTLSGVICAGAGVLDYAGFHIVPQVIANGSRSSGLTIHPNYLALTAAMAMPTALLWIGRSRRWTIFGAASVAALLGGEFASGSRAGAVAILLAFAGTIAFVPRLRTKIGVLVPLAGMVLVPALVFTRAGNQILDQVRLNGETVNTAGSNFERGRAHAIAYRQFGARPIQGVGIAVIEDAHNIYLQIVAAGGVIMASSFLVFFGGLAASVRRGLAGPQRDEAAALGIAILVWLANGMFDAQLADKYLYVIPGLLIAVARVSTQRVSVPVTITGRAVVARERLAPSSPAPTPVAV